jgi:hypothetical protein
LEKSKSSWILVSGDQLWWQNLLIIADPQKHLMAVGNGKPAVMDNMDNGCWSPQAKKWQQF